MNKIYKNRFSIGLSLAISVDEYKQIIEKFGDYIYGIYFSPPLGKQFHSRHVIAEQLEMKENVDRLFQVLELFEHCGFVVDADINMSPLTNEDIESFIEFIKQNKIVTEITAIEPYGKVIHQFLPNMKMLYSFNNFYSGEKVPDYYETIVLGKKYLKDYQSINSLIASGKKVKLLINNGCSYNCGTCRNGTKQCFKTVSDNLKMESVNELYAKQTLFPWELYELVRRIDNNNNLIFKISNRTSGFSYLYKCLKAYTEFQYIHPYIDEGIHNYALFSRIGPMEAHFDELNYEMIEHIKYDYWYGVCNEKI